MALFVFVLFLRVNYIFCINITDGISMYPTLQDGQITLGSSIANYERGDIIVAWPNEGDTRVIKRIIALPGETIEAKGSHIYIDGAELEEDYTNSHYFDFWFKYTLGENEYFIMGDNRDNSYDSRIYGPIKKDQLINKVYIILGNSK